MIWTSSFSSVTVLKDLRASRYSILTIILLNYLNILSHNFVIHPRKVVERARRFFLQLLALIVTEAKITLCGIKQKKLSVEGRNNY